MKSRAQSEAEHYDRQVQTEMTFSFYEPRLLAMLRSEAFRYIEPFHGKDLLFYGSGVNWSTACDFANAGAKVQMIDISPESVKQLNQNISKKGMESSVTARVMNCEELEFADQSFDIVYGRAILHHLDLQKALAEIARVLKPGGKAAFIEPLGYNPLLNLYRKLTPGHHTPDEHPLLQKDFDLMKEFFPSFRHEEFTLTTLGVIIPNAVLRYLKLPTFPVDVFNRLDRRILRSFPWLGRFCWNTVLCLER